MTRKTIHDIADEWAERLAPELLRFNERQVTAEYGERCSVVQVGCPICDAWAMFDKWGICPTAEQLIDYQRHPRR